MSEITYLTILAIAIVFNPVVHARADSVEILGLTGEFQAGDTLTVSFGYELSNEPYAAVVLFRCYGTGRCTSLNQVSVVRGNGTGSIEYTTEKSSIEYTMDIHLELAKGPTLAKSSSRHIRVLANSPEWGNWGPGTPQTGQGNVDETQFTEATSPSRNQCFPPEEWVRISPREGVHFSSAETISYIDKKIASWGRRVSRECPNDWGNCTTITENFSIEAGGHISFLSTFNIDGSLVKACVESAQLADFDPHNITAKVLPGGNTILKLYCRGDEHCVQYTDCRPDDVYHSSSDPYLVFQIENATGGVCDEEHAVVIGRAFSHLIQQLGGTPDPFR